MHILTAHLQPQENFWLARQVTIIDYYFIDYYYYQVILKM